MNWRPSDELGRLLNGLADGVLGDEEEARLAQILRGDAAARRHYRQFMTLHAGLMWDYAAAAGAPSEEQPDRSSTAQPRRFRVVAAILAAAAVVATLFATRDRSTHELVTLDSVTGAVSWSGNAGELRAGLQAEATLHEGSLTLEGDGATAQMHFRDGTIIGLSGEAELAFADNGQKRLVLKRGTISAHVKPQPSGSPMRIRTPTAEIEVVGTVFNLAARPADTWLKVDEGAVRFKRLSDGHVIDVPAQSTALASLNTAQHLSAVTTPRPLHEWSYDFASSIPPERWRGVWHSSPEGGRMLATAYVARRNPDGTTITHFGVSIRTAELNPPVALTAREDSIIHYRLKQDSPAPLQLMLLTSDGKGGYGGNFECTLPADRLHPDSSGWCTVEIPLSQFAPADPRPSSIRKHPTPFGNILTSILISSYRQDTRLTVSSFQLLAPSSR